MSISLKRSFYVLSNKLRRPRQPAERMKKKWIADFSKSEKSCFTIKSEISYDAYLEKGSLFLGLKKKNCMAWLETVSRVYVDQCINTHFHFDGDGYCAAGIMFRIAGQGSYYLALVSSKGYFRLDAVNNNIPRPLIGWTEAPGLNGCEANLGIIAKGDHLIFILNGRWIAEVNDDSIPGGHLGFALVSYDSDLPATEMESSVVKEGYICQSWLDSLSVDSRAGMVEAEYQKWNDGTEISAESRFRLAKSLATLDHFGAAYNQILKAWKQREESIKTVTATYTEMRTRGELLFAAQMAVQLGHYATAEEHINDCFAMGVDGDDRLNVFAEKTKILSAQNKYSDLVFLLPEYIKQMESAFSDGARTNVPSLYALLGYACWNLDDYIAAATAWCKAFSLDNSNGLYAVSAANAFERMGNDEEALRYRLDAAQCFLQQGNYTDLEALTPQLQAAMELMPDSDTTPSVSSAEAKSRGSPPEQPMPEKAERKATAGSAEKSKATPAKTRKTPAKEKAAPPKPKAAKKPQAEKKVVKKPEKKPTAKAKTATAKKTPVAKKPAVKAKPAVKPATAKKTTAKPRGRPRKIK